MIAGLLLWIIPDVPTDVKIAIHRESEFEQQILFADENKDEHVEDKIVTYNDLRTHHEYTSRENREATGTEDTLRFRGNNSTVSPL